MKTGWEKKKTTWKVENEKYIATTTDKQIIKLIIMQAHNK